MERASEPQQDSRVSSQPSRTPTAVRHPGDARRVAARVGSRASIAPREQAARASAGRISPPRPSYPSYGVMRSRLAATNGRAMFQSIVDTISGSPWSYGDHLRRRRARRVLPGRPERDDGDRRRCARRARRPAHRADPDRGGGGAICGDNVSFWIGKTLGERIAEKLFAGDRRRHLDRAHKLVEERGGYLIVIAPLHPGGRTAVTFAAGSLDWAWTRFIKFDVVAGVIWGVVREPARLLRRQDLRGQPVQGLPRRIRGRARDHLRRRGRALVRKRGRAS